jgi:thiol oxidase
MCWKCVLHWHKLEQSNRAICARFDIQSYPTFYWGAPEALASGGASSAAIKGLESVDGKAVSTAEDLLQWINQRINKINFFSSFNIWCTRL